MNTTIENINSDEVRNEINKFLTLSIDDQNKHKNKFIGMTVKNNIYSLYYILKSSQRYSRFQSVASRKFKKLFYFNNASSLGFTHFKDDELSQVTMFRYEIIN